MQQHWRALRSLGMGCDRDGFDPEAPFMIAKAGEMYQARVNASNGNIIISSFELLPLWPLWFEHGPGSAENNEQYYAPVVRLRRIHAMVRNAFVG